MAPSRRHRSLLGQTPTTLQLPAIFALHDSKREAGRGSEPRRGRFLAPIAPRPRRASDKETGGREAASWERSFPTGLVQRQAWRRESVNPEKRATAWPECRPVIGPLDPAHVAIYVAISVPNRAGTRRSVPLGREQACCFTRESGAPGGIRTPDHLIRSQMLYPLSYGRADSDWFHAYFEHLIRRGPSRSTDTLLSSI
jgi:hypothetical protein